MAKSIRSKWRRKMRSERREKFGKKELEKLKSIVQKSEKSDDVEMKNLYTGETSNNGLTLLPLPVMLTESLSTSDKNVSFKLQ